MDQTDVRIVSAQIGRHPRGTTEVAVRCAYGLPAVVRTEPRLESGEPFPTLYWLTCPAAARAAGRLEAGGFMRTMAERLSSDEAFADRYHAANESYVADRDGVCEPGASGAGGMPDRVKCLHALYAHHLVGGDNPVGAEAAARIEPVDCSGPCVAP